LYYGERNFAEAERHLSRAIELNPSYPTAYHWYSLVLSATARHEQAVENIKNAIRLEPRSAIIHTAASLIYYHAGNFPDALIQANEALVIDNGFVPAYKMLRVIHGALGNYDGAFDAYQKERQFSGNPEAGDPHWLMISAQVEAYGNQREKALESLQRSLAAPTVRNDVKSFGFEFAAAYALLGETEKALEWLERSKKAGTPNLVLIQVDARFDKIRDDARFKKFVANLFE
jgi:tetratricopeptide (TPR) repeat protein